MAYDIRLPVPLVCQRDPSTTDNRPNENESLNCGESCCASAVGYIAGVTLLPDEIHDVIWSQTNRTPETSGPTDAPDLIGFLATRAGITATEHSVSSTGTAMSAIRQALFQNHVLIALRYFSTIGQPPYHWVLVCGAAGPDDTHTTSVQFLDPWTGTLVTQSNTDFFGWMAPYYQDGSHLLISLDTDPRR